MKLSLSPLHAIDSIMRHKWCRALRLSEMSPIEHTKWPKLRHVVKRKFSTRVGACSPHQNVYGCFLRGGGGAARKSPSLKGPCPSPVFGTFKVEYPRDVIWRIALFPGQFFAFISPFRYKSENSAWKWGYLAGSRGCIRYSLVPMSSCPGVVLQFWEYFETAKNITFLNPQPVTGQVASIPGRLKIRPGVYCMGDSAHALVMPLETGESPSLFLKCFMVVVRITQILGNCVAHVQWTPGRIFNRCGFEAIQAK